ncbi:serine/threonine protein kinase [Anncaliia algerae PRA339]|uniref:Serine/threonine protein kinase n=1 Tax=Anncaliia algerae PRA339 TaxID=1288291 RepID=A0A059EZM0_9MICR|nr:serine/threonine protein kinase [Anncaliia algerae PRA339]
MKKITPLIKSFFRSKKSIKAIILLIFIIFIYISFYYYSMKKKITVSEEILDIINNHVEECIKYEDKREQKQMFMKLYHPMIDPVNITPTTAVFLYHHKVKFIIKRVIFREDSPTQEDVISMSCKSDYIMKTYSTLRREYEIKEWDEYQETEITKKRTIIWLLCEYLPIKISQREINKNEEKIKKIAKDVLLGLKYLHDRNIAHLDIKIANIMGTFTNGIISYKLIDLGYARDLSLNGIKGTEEVYIPKKSFGTFPYKPPEIVKENVHALKSDVYCVGAVVWFLSIGYIPFYYEGEKDVDLFRKFVSGKVKLKFKDSSSELLRDFVTKAMTRDRNERPSVEKMLQHPFLY